MNRKTIKIQAKMHGVQLMIGEPLEEKLSRQLRTGEPITDTVPPMYDETEEGEVDPRCDIRADKFDYATKLKETRKADAQKMLQDAGRAVPSAKEEDGAEAAE